MALPTILAIALCWLVIPATPFVILGILSHRNKPSTDNNADSHCAQGAGEGVCLDHVAARNTTVSE